MPTAIARLIDVARRAGVSWLPFRAISMAASNCRKARRRASNAPSRRWATTPTRHARSLSRGRSDTIGLVIPDIANPYFAVLAAAAERAADRHGLALVLCVTLNQRAREHEYLQRLGRNHLDGLIFITNHPDDGSLAGPINKANRRVVILDEDVEGARGPKIFSDNEQGGYLAGRHLVEAGHRRIAFFGGPEQMMSTQARLAGCRRAFAEAPSPAEIAPLLFGGYSVAEGRRAAEELMRRKDAATAVFAVQRRDRHRRA